MLPIYMIFFLNVGLLTSVTTIATLIRPRHPRFPDTYPYPGGHCSVRYNCP